MRERTLLKIGEFARVGQVSIATLRHYEKEGLLKANALDPETGYRYYALDQLPRLNRILALKDLGFPLEQIARLLEEDMSLEQLRGMFMLKQTQTQQMIETEQARLTRIAARLRQIEQEGKMPAYEVLLKQVDSLPVAFILERIPLGEDLWRSYEKITAYLAQQGVQQKHPEMLLLHSRYELQNDIMSIDVETAVPIAAGLPRDPMRTIETNQPQIVQQGNLLRGNEAIDTRTLPGGWMACTVHTGDAHLVGQAFGALYGWMKEHGYRLIGFPRQVRWQYGEQMESSRYVTEVQFPVEKL
ncbi:MAG TPA: MerR family transcriptional regulator [Ktedonosporobacter sp.]|nr:MerR family transcriptional regulator [Ktedonosporobacter sp.]